MELLNIYQGKVYALKSHQTPNIYVGSTTGSISTRLICHRSSHKLYKNTKNKEYYNNNKEKISLRAKTLCPCGGSYTKANKAQHEKTHKHVLYIT